MMPMSTTVNDDSLKTGLAASAFLHTLFFLFLYFGLPVFFTPLPEHHAPVPFEIVEIADLTNTRIKEPEPQTRLPEPPPKPPEPKPAPPQVQAIPEPKQLEPEPDAMKPVPKPKPPEVAKPKPDQFAKLLKNLEAHKNVEKPKADTKTDSKQASQEASSQAPALSDRLTISQEDALRRQIEQCWSPPIGARNAETMIVGISLDVNPDKTVQHAEIVDKVRMATDSFYRAAAEAALRAVLNPSCSPLSLPDGKYEQWKHIDFTFDPRDIL